MAAKIMPLFKCPLEREKIQRLFKFMLILGVVAFSLALIVYAYLGFFSRYWADDYCFSALAKNHGFWGGLKEHYLTWSNRYTAYLLSVKWDWLGVINVQLYPAVMIFSLVAGLTINAKIILKKLQLPNSLLISILLGEMTTFFILYEAPNLFQSLYWRSGMVSYFAPVVLLAFVNLMVLIQLDIYRMTQKQKLLWSFPTAVMVFFAMGTSETFAALLCGYLVLLGIYLWIHNHSLIKIPSFFYLLLLAAFIGGLIITLSAGNQVRMQFLNPVNDFFTFLRLSINNAGLVMVQSLLGSILPNLVNFLIVFFLFYHLSAQSKKTIKLTIPLIFMIICFIGAGFLLICMCAPTVFSMQAFPEPRALILGRAVIIFMIMGMGALSGLVSHQFIDQIVDTCLASILIMAILVTVYPIRAALRTWNEIPAAQKRADIWDARKKVIEQAIGNGQDHLDLTPINSVNGIYEITSDTEFWVNTCAADYYGIKSLRAIDKP